MSGLHVEIIIFWALTIAVAAILGYVVARRAQKLAADPQRRIEQLAVLDPFYRPRTRGRVANFDIFLHA
jgi:hypothetical protein